MLTSYAAPEHGRGAVHVRECDTISLKMLKFPIAFRAATLSTSRYRHQAKALVTPSHH